MYKVIWGLLILVLVSGCSTVPMNSSTEEQGDYYEEDDENRDPWESYNRSMYAFNDTLDHYFLKPVAKGYRHITPQIIDDGVSNFFGNFTMPLVIVNDLLQVKFWQAGKDSLRFIVNSTLGIFGFFDVASSMYLPPNREDFGQTLGYWGVPSGPYVVLPFFGPSTVRDGLSLVPDFMVGFTINMDTGVNRYAMFALGVVDVRADLLPFEKAAAGDKYVFIREVYLQKREYDVLDGEIEDTFGDDFGDD